MESSSPCHLSPLEDTFLTIAAETEGIYKSKGSKFLAFAYPVDSEDEVKEKVNLLRKKYFDARHHCYAFRLGINGKRYRANDDGEPAHSAGKPILGQLLAYDLTNTLVVVVRYFGGVLLGVGGLIQAYKNAAADALSKAEIVPGIETEVYGLSFKYADMTAVFNLLKAMNLDSYDKLFQDDCFMKVKVRKSQVEQFREQFESVGSIQLSVERGEGMKN